MSLLRIPFFQHESNYDDEEIRDVSEILEAGRPPRLSLIHI